MRVRMLTLMAVLAAVVGLVAYSSSRSSDRVDPSEGTTTTTPAAVGTPATPIPVPTDAAITEPPAASRAAEDAAREGLTVAFTWFPATDATRNEAYGRARRWLTDALAGRMVMNATTERGPGVRWTHWAQQQTKIVAEVSIECSGCPADTDDVVRRVATIKQTAISGDRATAVTPDTTVWVAVVRERDRWLIDDVRY
ncbi:hypothetical protein [Rhodococcus sp. O3]|uniref:hypothetical protein n=1 Tax=Rhodococcus sp. O3 TaxID=3404919 RepID=UPI003B67F8CF